MKNELKIGLSYNDVLLVPKRSNVESRRDVDTSTNIAKGIKLETPVISANMDTVTESNMAISIAREGGIGIIHRFMSIEDEANEVVKVKRAEAYVIDKPYGIDPRLFISDAKEMMSKLEVSGLLVIDKNNKLLGILSDRDIRFASDGKKVCL
ncbi:MAG: IMP dehydrogenase [Candidatus Marsarchaeota archaeon]|nr:IMP dehydrogenase [Candidatus Marsarchaeota archaeon]